MDKDEFAGQGGSYVVGKDGKRELVERTKPPGDPVAKANESAQPAPALADPKPAKSNRKE